MKTKIYFHLLLCLIFQSAIAQSSSLEKINLGNWGIINLPKSMEVQSGIYKKIVDEAKKEFSVNAERVVFQQKGLNQGNNKQTYARVIIRTDTAQENFPNLSTEKVTPKDLTDLNQSYKSQTYEVANNPTYPAKIISWNNLKIVTINGQKCLNYSYTRKMGNNPETYSEFFIFWKGKKQHTLNIEYRINETAKWKTELVNCVNSFKFQ